MVRNIIAVIVGLLVGNIFNFIVLQAGLALMTMPEGFDKARIPETIHLFSAQHYAVPFLAHALGSFVGTLVAMFIAVSSRKILTSILAVLFLSGGIAASLIIPAPAWFVALDLIVAYVPMAFLAWKISGKP